MLNNPEIQLPEESDPDLKKIKDSLTGQEEGSPVRRAVSDYLDETSLVIQRALLDIMYGRVERAPGENEYIKKELTDAISKSGEDLEEVRSRIREGSYEYGNSYTQLRGPAMRYINKSAAANVREQPVLAVLGRTISGGEVAYEAQLIGKFKAIDKIRQVNNITTFVNNLNKPAAPK